MKTLSALYILITCIAILFISPLHGANKYKTISATACDSLIKANEKNPNFVILDVRTPVSWLADHLTGSIVRNYYDTDFNTQLSFLPKHKIYLLHCQAGSRSAPTLTMMKNLNFAEVYEMSGGINAWKSKLLPTTAKFAPRLMLVSNGGSKKGTVQYGKADTLKITVTNRANDTLKFVSFTAPAGNEFSSNFDLKKKLKGSEDYTFSVYYKPLQFNKDSVIVGISSNGGELKFSVILKKGTVQGTQIISFDEPKIYPNPAKGFIVFGNISAEIFQEVILINPSGQIVKKELNFPSINPLSVADLPDGMYFVRMVSGGRTIVNKLIISR